MKKLDKIDKLAMEIYMSGHCTVAEAYKKAKAEVDCGLPKEFEELFSNIKRR